MNTLISNIDSMNLLATFLLAFFISLIATPLSKKFAFKVGCIAYPNERTMHKKPMPVGGGLAIVFGFISTILIMVLVSKQFDIFSFMGLIVGGLLIAILGFLDDLYDLNAKLRFSVQILAALIVVQSGVVVEGIQIPFLDTYLKFGSMAKPMTIFWIVGVTNAFNFIDGLDGLVAGVSSIASICLMFLSIIYNQPLAIILTAALAGSCLGFLPHNFNPATIFMGDTGATFLGFTLAVISIQGLIKSYTAVTLIVVILVLGLPIIDTTFAIVRRVLNGKPIYQADRGHLHHRLVDRGYSQKRAVLTLYGISGCFGIAGILFAETEITLALLILGIIILVVLRGSFKCKNNSDTQK